MLWVIPTLNFKMINHTSHNIGLIDSWVSHQASNDYTEKTNLPKANPECIIIDNEELIQQCAVCQRVPFFPIISDCSHLFCADCFAKLFSNHHSDEESIRSAAKCPICQVNVDYMKIRSGQQELSANPDSKYSKFFQMASIKCVNGCTLNSHKILDFATHQYFECERRVIKCPAKDCPTMTSAHLLQQHMKECPFMYIYCAKCLTGFRVGILSHDCTITLRQHFERLQAKGVQRLVSNIYPHVKHGDIILPTVIPRKDLVTSLQEHIQKIFLRFRWLF